MKLSKQQQKQHNKACELLEQETLSYDDKLFILEHWHEGVAGDVSFNGAFFTPIDLASDFSIEIPRSYQKKQMKLLDLCAGIGALAFFAYHYADDENKPSIICVERNHAYVEVGRKLLPEATWICGDALEYCQENNGKIFFDYAFSNPPFGNKKTGEYKLIEAALNLTDCAAFILPVNSAPFQYSGVQCFKRNEHKDYKNFADATGIHLDAGCGIDTSIHRKDWKCTNIVTEVVTAERQEDFMPVQELPDTATAPQFELFA
jgi:predicted RNA methylase